MLNKTFLHFLPSFLPCSTWLYRIFPLHFQKPKPSFQIQVLPNISLVLRTFINAKTFKNLKGMPEICDRFFFSSKNKHNYIDIQDVVHEFPLTDNISIKRYSYRIRIKMFYFAVGANVKKAYFLR